MTPRPLPRTGPIPFANPALAWVPVAETPRALYAVTRQWQGRPEDAVEPDHAVASSAAHPTGSSASRAPRDTGPCGTDILARYRGQGSLCVRSSVTGRHYRFQGQGDTLRVDKHDQALLRRITDIELL